MYSSKSLQIIDKSFSKTSEKKASCSYFKHYLTTYICIYIYYIATDWASVNVIGSFPYKLPFDCTILESFTNQQLLPLGDSHHCQIALPTACCSPASQQPAVLLTRLVAGWQAAYADVPNKKTGLEGNNKNHLIYIFYIIFHSSWLGVTHMFRIYLQSRRVGSTSASHRVWF